MSDHLWKSTKKPLNEQTVAQPKITIPRSSSAKLRWVTRQ